MISMSTPSSNRISWFGEVGLSEMIRNPLPRWPLEALDLHSFLQPDHVHVVRANVGGGIVEAGHRVLYLRKPVEILRYGGGSSLRSGARPGGYPER
jgi:hypothetical protein